MKFIVVDRIWFTFLYKKQMIVSIESNALRKTYAPIKRYHDMFQSFYFAEIAMGDDTISLFKPFKYDIFNKTSLSLRECLNIIKFDIFK